MKLPTMLRQSVRANPFLYPLLNGARKVSQQTGAQASTALEQLQRSLRGAGENGLGLVNAYERFLLFRPASAADFKLSSALTVLAVNQTFPFLAELAKTLTGNDCAPLSPEQLNQHLQLPNIDAEPLAALFNQYGSDKSRHHNYHEVYATLLGQPDAVNAVLEIGMGSNDTSIASNMGAAGKPGASLRGFRDYLPNAQVFGADFDAKILFSEERIESFFVDQTEPSTLAALAAKLPDNFDLIIDDGLHSPNANIATLNFALPKVRVGGWVVIEDISEFAVPVWPVVASMLPTERYRSCIVKTDVSWMFLVQRLQ